MMFAVMSRKTAGHATIFCCDVVMFLHMRMDEPRLELKLMIKLLVLCEQRSKIANDKENQKILTTESLENK